MLLVPLSTMAGRRVLPPECTENHVVVIVETQGTLSIDDRLDIHHYNMSVEDGKIETLRDAYATGSALSADSRVEHDSRCIVEVIIMRVPFKLMAAF